MLCDTLAYAADNGCIDGCPRDNDLAFRKRGQVIQQIASHPLDGGGDAFLIYLVHNAHNTLCLALAKYIGVQLARALADESHAYTELTPLRQHLLEYSRRDYLGAAGREVVGLFDQYENRVGQVELARVDFAAFRIHTRLVQPPQQRSHDYLLISLIDFVQLQHRALSRLENLRQVQVLRIVKGEAVLETLLDPPRQRV